MLKKAVWLLILFSAPMIKADTLDFSLTGEGSTYTFQLASSPSSLESIGDGYAVPNVIITLDGVDELAAEVAFFETSHGGGMELVGGIPQLAGPQVYSVDQSTVTLDTGTYHLTNSADDAPYTLLVTEDVSTSTPPVPEPPTLLLVLTSLIGGAVLGRKYGWGRSGPTRVTTLT